MHEWSYSMPPPSSNAIHLKKTAKLISPGAGVRVKRHDHHQTLTVLHISDTHWDPLYKEGTLANCKDFLCCREDSGEVRGRIRQIQSYVSIFRCMTRMTRLATGETPGSVTLRRGL